jgi:hypothetical protein
MGQNEHGLLLHVQDAISVDPGVRRKRHIDKRRVRQVVTLRAHREMDAIERAATGAKSEWRRSPDFQAPKMPG